MKEHPILFSTKMVRAILTGKKTVTRRLSNSWLKVKAGDLLWVRETFAFIDCWDHAKAEMRTSAERLRYRSDFNSNKPDPQDPTSLWAPSIHMPRWASRITLRATADARLKRLQDITEEEAIAEGCSASEEMTAEDLASLGPQELELALALGSGAFTAKLEYMQLWDSLNGKTDPWQSNPEVVRIAFKREQS